MEEIMYFFWQQRMWSLLDAGATASVEVLHPGVRNTTAGPDFFDAKVRINGLLWAGDVEMHYRASDWFKHGHQHDAAYRSVILHVVAIADAVVRREGGEAIPTVIMRLPVMARAANGGLTSPFERTPSLRVLLPGAGGKGSIHCAPWLSTLPPVIIHDMLTALALERLTEKAQRVTALTEATGGLTWMEACYVTLARSLGTDTNADAMERTARSLPLSCLLHHRDHPLQVRALLLGQSGLLLSSPTPSTPAVHLGDVWGALQDEYRFLQVKFRLTPLPEGVWKTGGVRPQAHPLVRLCTLSALLERHDNLLRTLLDTPDTAALYDLFSRDLPIGAMTTHSVLINTVAPLFLAYALFTDDEALRSRAVDLLTTLPAERNRYTLLWQQHGLTPSDAFSSQALLALSRQYCEPHKCLFCRLGTYLLRHA